MPEAVWFESGRHGWLFQHGVVAFLGFGRRVRATILTYVEEKLAGLYGHNKKQLRRFVAFMVEATALTDSDARKDHPTKYAA